MCRKPIYQRPGLAQVCIIGWLLTPLELSCHEGYPQLSMCAKNNLENASAGACLVVNGLNAIPSYHMDLYSLDNTVLFQLLFCFHVRLALLCYVHRPRPEKNAHRQDMTGKYCKTATERRERDREGRGDQGSSPVHLMMTETLSK